MLYTYKMVRDVMKRDIAYHTVHAAKNRSKSPALAAQHIAVAKQTQRLLDMMLDAMEYERHNPQQV